MTRNTSPIHTGRHFLQIPGSINVPDQVLRAIDMPTIDHRSKEFGRLGLEVIEGLSLTGVPHRDGGAKVVMAVLKKAS